MSGIRHGVVLQIDIEEEHGTIIDDNCQDIHFLTEKLIADINVGDKVSFEIHFGSTGLSAVNINLQ